VGWEVGWPECRGFVPEGREGDGGGGEAEVTESGGRRRGGVA